MGGDSYSREDETTGSVFYSKETDPKWWSNRKLKCTHFNPIVLAFDLTTDDNELANVYFNIYYRYCMINFQCFMDK